MGREREGGEMREELEGHWRIRQITRFIHHVGCICVKSLNPLSLNPRP